VHGGSCLLVLCQPFPLDYVVAIIAWRPRVLLACCCRHECVARLGQRASHGWASHGWASHGRASHGREATVGKPRARQINCNQQPTTTINQHSRWLLLLLVRCSFVVCSVRFGSVSCLLLARSLSRSLVFIDLCVWSVVCGVWCVHFAVLAAACIY